MSCITELHESLANCWWMNESLDTVSGARHTAVTKPPYVCMCVHPWGTTTGQVNEYICENAGQSSYDQSVPTTPTCWSNWPMINELTTASDVGMTCWWVGACVRVSVTIKCPLRRTTWNLKGYAMCRWVVMVAGRDTWHWSDANMLLIACGVCGGKGGRTGARSSLPACVVLLWVELVVLWSIGPEFSDSPPPTSSSVT